MAPSEKWQPWGVSASSHFLAAPVFFSSASFPDSPISRITESVR